MIQQFFSFIFDNKIIELVRPYYRKVLFAIVFSLMVSGTNGAIAWLLKPIIDSIFVEKKYALLAWLPFAIVVLYTIQGVCHLAYSYLIRSAGFQLLRDTRSRLYTHLQQLPVSSFSKESSGEMQSRILNDTIQAQRILSNILLAVFKNIPTILVLVAVALYRRWDVTLLSLIVLPGIFIYTHHQGKRVNKKRRKAQEQIGSLAHLINELISGVKVVKSFLNENGLIERFKQTNDSQYSQETKIVLYNELTRLIVNVSTGIGIGLVIWYGGHLVINGTISSGDLFSAIGAIVMIFSPIKEISKAYAHYHEIKAATDRLWWLDNMEIEKNGNIPLVEFKKEIRYENVSYKYTANGDFVLHNIDLTIRKGETVAFVGSSGSGKTTMVDLLPRFYDPGHGRVLMDNVNIAQAKLADLRKLIGLVGQDVILFNDTIKANIAFGMSYADDAAIEQAARHAYAHDFIMEQPDGYATFLGERGGKLSGGQRQRIAIARAILKNAPILILDEATSALDSTSETLVQKALEELMDKKTTIIVAHRLSTIRNADRIVVMDQGRIVDQGSHKDLLQKSSLYQELNCSFESVGNDTLAQPPKC